MYGYVLDGALDACSSTPIMHKFVTKRDGMIVEIVVAERLEAAKVSFVRWTDGAMLCRRIGAPSM